MAKARITRWSDRKVAAWHNFSLINDLIKFRVIASGISVSTSCVAGATCSMRMTSAPSVNGTFDLAFTALCPFQWVASSTSGTFKIYTDATCTSAIFTDTLLGWSASIFGTSLAISAGIGPAQLFAATIPRDLLLDGVIATNVFTTPTTSISCPAGGGIFGYNGQIEVYALC